MSDALVDLGVEDRDDRSRAAFGEGGQVPYERALTTRDGGRLRLCAVGEAGSRDSSVVDVDRFTASADDVDVTLLHRTTGSVLDLGCGPGRMVRAAMDAGRHALGIDVSASAIHMARADGLPVLQASVFDALPREGTWTTVLLLDGNLGIGGDVAALLRRAAALVAPNGRIVVEAHRRRTHRREFDAVLVDDDGAASDPFPWAEMGADPLVTTARSVGLRVRDRWTVAGRTFVEIATRPLPRRAP